MLLSPLGFPARLAVDHRPETSHLPLAKRIYSAPYGRTNEVVVDMSSIEVSADYGLKLPAEQPLCKFQSKLMRKFRRHFTGGEALYQVETLHILLLMPHFFDSAHIFKGSFTGAAESRFEQILLRLIPVESIIHSSAQGVCILRTGGLVLIERIIDGIIQAVDGDNTGICDRLPILLYFFPDLTRQPGHFLHTLLAGFAVGIGHFCKLICIVAEPRNLVEQICVVVAGLGSKLSAHDEGAEKFLTRQAARFHLHFQMCQLLFVEMEGDDVISFSHWGLLFNAAIHSILWNSVFVLSVSCSVLSLLSEFNGRRLPRGAGALPGMRLDIQTLCLQNQSPAGIKKGRCRVGIVLRAERFLSSYIV